MLRRWANLEIAGPASGAVFFGPFSEGDTVVGVTMHFLDGAAAPSSGDVVSVGIFESDVGLGGFDTGDSLGPVLLTVFTVGEQEFPVGERMAGKLWVGVRVTTASAAFNAGVMLEVKQGSHRGRRGTTFVAPSDPRPRVRDPLPPVGPFPPRNPR